MRAQVLERLLAMAAFALGIELRHSRAAVGICREHSGEHRPYVASLRDTPLLAEDAAANDRLPEDFSLCNDARDGGLARAVDERWYFFILYFFFL